MNVWHANMLKPFEAILPSLFQISTNMTIYRPIYHFGGFDDMTQKLKIGSYHRYFNRYPTIQHENPI